MAKTYTFDKDTIERVREKYHWGIFPWAIAEDLNLSDEDVNWIIKKFC